LLGRMMAYTMPWGLRRNNIRETFYENKRFISFCSWNNS